MQKLYNPFRVAKTFTKSFPGAEPGLAYNSLSGNIIIMDPRYRGDDNSDKYEKN
jgi:hypothetical protein